MTNKKDPLEDLFVNGDDVNRKLLSDVLGSLILIDNKTSKPRFQKGFKNLEVKYKLIAYLLYRRILLLLGRIEENALGITGPEIEKETGIKQGSLYPAVRSLENIIRNSEEIGGYYIIDYSINEAVSILHEFLGRVDK